MVEIGLHRVCPGCRGVVTQIDTKPALKQRLQDFGFVPGTEVRCCYRGPGGAVTALGFRGTVVDLRTKDLRAIQVRC